jgi:hypothetical protein
MSRRNIPSTPTRGTTDPALAPQIDNSNPPLADVSQALLDLLRRLNTQAREVPPLEGRALQAVLNHRKIATDLRTLADPPAASFQTAVVPRA